MTKASTVVFHIPGHHDASPVCDDAHFLVVYLDYVLRVLIELSLPRFVGDRISTGVGPPYSLAALSSSTRHPLCETWGYTAEYTLSEDNLTHSYPCAMVYQMPGTRPAEAHRCHHQDRLDPSRSFSPNLSNRRGTALKTSATKPSRLLPHPRPRLSYIAGPPNGSIAANTERNTVVAAMADAAYIPNASRRYVDSGVCIAQSINNHDFFSGTVRTELVERTKTN